MAFFKTGVFPFDPSIMMTKMMAPSLELLYCGHLPLKPSTLVIQHIQHLSAELTTSSQHNDQIEQSLLFSMLILHLLKFLPTLTQKHQLKYI
jgi:hypothetical protein